MLEGLTDYFTGKLLAKRFGRTFSSSSSREYRKAQEFAAALVARVGEKKALEIFVSRSGNLIDELRTASGLGSRFDDAANALEAGNHEEAIQLIR